MEAIKGYDYWKLQTPEDVYPEREEEGDDNDLAYEMARDKELTEEK